MMFMTVTLYFMLCLLPVIDSSEVSESGPYFVSDDVGHWTSTGPNCTLAIPAFSTEQTGNLIIEENTELLTALRDERNKIWVGYFLAFQNFEYIGCVYLNESLRNNTSFHTKNDPGLCYSVCQTKYVGIVTQANQDGPNCFCMASKDINILEDHCDEACADKWRLKDILCGGKSRGKIYLSLYEIETNANVPASSNGICCFKNTSTNKMEWSFGENEFRTACKSVENKLELISESRSWKESMQICIEKGLNQISASETRINVTNNPEVWTAIVRRQTVFNISKKSKNPMKVGYIIRRGGNIFELKFGKKTERFRSLCAIEQSLTSTSTIASSSLETEYTTNFQSTSGATSTVTNEPSAMLSSDKQMGPGEYVGVSIGVSLGLGIVAAAVVILWRKRSKNTHQGEAQYANQVENAGYESDHPVSIKLQNENKRPPNEIYESNYDEIENEAHRAGPVSDEYDTTNAVRMNAHLDKTDNVYNRLGALEEMYNHVGPPVTVDQASMYGYNCGEGPVRDTDGVNNEYFTLEPGLGVGQPGQPKSETYGNELPEQDTNDVEHEYLTLEPGHGAGQPREPKSETYGFELPKQDNDGVNHDYFTLEPTLVAGQPGEPKSETYGNVLPEQDTNDVNHDYFTLELGHGAGQPGEPEPETYGNMWPANDQNKGVFPDEDDTYNHI